MKEHVRAVLGALALSTLACSSPIPNDAQTPCGFTGGSMSSSDRLQVVAYVGAIVRVKLLHEGQCDGDAATRDVEVGLGAPIISTPTPEATRDALPPNIDGSVVTVSTLSTLSIRIHYTEGSWGLPDASTSARREASTVCTFDPAHGDALVCALE